MFHNYDHALLGRILICGNPGKVSIDIIHSMDQAILCRITALKDNYSFGVRPYMLRITTLIEGCCGVTFNGVIRGRPKSMVGNRQLQHHHVRQ